MIETFSSEQEREALPVTKVFGKKRVTGDTDIGKVRDRNEDAFWS